MATPSAPLIIHIPAALGSASADVQSAFPCLDTLIARGNSERSRLRGDAMLLALLGGIDSEGTARGALLHFAQSGKIEHETWRIVASPLHLVADHQTLHLPSEQPCPLSEEEGRALFATTQAFFAEEGWQLDYGDGRHWLLHLSTHTAITTTPPHEAAGRSLFETLPQGKDAAIWRRWSNEAQMLFHGHAVNEARRSRGEPLINSLWFWGEGRLPQLAPTAVQRVVGGDPFVRGVAQLAGIEWQPLPRQGSSLDALLSAGPLLLVLDNSERERWEQQWFCPVRELLRRKRLTAVELQFEDGHRVRLTPAMLWRLWRRRHLTLTGETYAE